MLRYPGLVTKNQFLPKAQKTFQEFELNVTDLGRPYLGTAIGSEDFMKQFVTLKVEELVQDLQTLADVAQTQPQASTQHLFMNLFINLHICAE